MRLKNRLNIDTLVPIHRIDRETAGLVMFSVQPAERDAYGSLFRQHKVEKNYEAIGPWRPEIDFPLTRKSRIVQDHLSFGNEKLKAHPTAKRTST